MKVSLIGFLPWRRRQEAEQSPFDKQHGVDTSGIVRIASMHIDSPNYVFARYYKATRPEVFSELMDGLGIKHSMYAFVDYGSGKGLTLLLASAYGFREIAGVEFGRELHEIAVRNIAAYSSTDRKTENIRSVCADAAEFELPGGPVVCYFYDPFEPPVLERVLENIQRSWEQNPRPVVVVYHGAPPDSALYAESAAREACFRRHSFLRRTRHDALGSVYGSPQVQAEIGKPAHV
ncbi:MAG TPA: class I SAM-dependent methyltransferase [Bryobacteraceae bacterium]|nr:class I SAM-dependent methyltransferase [Bryobacteraceae bacterium]